MESARALHRIHLEGFRSIRNLDLELGRITVLIGANGAGKSNLLSFFRMVPLIRTRSLVRFISEAIGASATLHYGPKVTPELSFRLDFQQGEDSNFYQAKLRHRGDDKLYFSEELVGFQAAGTNEPRTYALGSGHIESDLDEQGRDPTKPTQRTVRWWLSRMSFFHFHDTSISSSLRKNAKAHDTHFLRSDGSNLASYLLALRDSEAEDDRAAWRRIHAYVRQIAPFIKELRPTPMTSHGASFGADPDEPLPAEPLACRLFWIDERDEPFDVAQLSDGTLRAIALITALAQPASRLPLFISIDEPELGLHPAAMELLAGLVRSASHHCQILLATQSPALLDLFEPQEVVVVERSSGESVFRRLDPAALQTWLERYALSDLWYKNLLGGKP
jgi:predicted ATPase